MAAADSVTAIAAVAARASISSQADFDRFQKAQAHVSAIYGHAATDTAFEACRHASFMTPGYGKAWLAAGSATPPWAANTARALSARDLIGHKGCTQRHYDTLTLAYRLSIGTIHPDDQPVNHHRAAPPAVTHVQVDALSSSSGDLFDDNSIA